MKLGEIKEASAETEHRVEVPFGSNGDGRTLEVFYRPITPEVMEVPNIARQLDMLIIRWNIEDAEPEFDFLKGRPVPFLQTITEAIRADFFRPRES